MKRIICLLIVISMLIPVSYVGFAAEDELSWPGQSDTGMPFRPFNNYLSMNNPPSFAWPMIEDATYDIKVCTDKEMKKIAFMKENIPFNVYNFNEFFETDVKYYWSVRFKKGGAISVWSEPFQFMISADAYDNRFPEITEEFLTANLRMEHPRLCMPDEQREFIKNMSRDGFSYAYARNFADTFIANIEKNGMLTEADLKAEYDAGNLNVPSYKDIGYGLANTAIMYMMTEDEKYLNCIIDYLRHMKDWNPANMFPWGSNTDNVTVAYVLNLAFAYDWLYNELPQDVQESTVKLIETTFIRWWDTVASNSIYPKTNSLYAYIDRSHQWKVKWFCVAAFTIYEHSQLARDLLCHVLPLFINSLPFNYEDGSYNNGPYYYESHGALDPDLSDVLAYATQGAIDVRGTAGYQNRAYYLTYAWPVGGFMSFLGDQSRQTSSEANYYSAFLQHSIVNDNMSDIKRGVNAWMLGKNNVDSNDYYHGQDVLSITRTTDEVSAITPTMLPKSRYFKDDGLVSMFSDVSDDNKIAMLFRSSQGGSAGHMHPDQNSFIIQALGENLLVDSGYYDSVGSEFWLKWNAQTYAHNTITYNIGEGQPYSSKGAKGDIMGFLNHSDFDYLRGDATDAYNQGISKYVRDMIYVRPDTFIIIDDVAAREGEKAEFEWWVHTMGTMKLYESGTGVHMTKNEAAVDIQMAYPENLKPYYNGNAENGDFITPSGETVPFPKSKEFLGDVHLYFKTDYVDATKIVSVINIHKERDGQPYVKQTRYDNVLKLELEDGTICYVKLDDSESVTIDGYTFDGRALTVKGKRYMAVDATYLKKDKLTLMESDVPVTCAFGNKEIALSTLKSEANLKVYMPGAETFKIMVDENMVDIEPGKSHNGITPTPDGDYVNLSAYYGYYTLYVNDKVLPGSEETVYLTQTLDGVTETIEVKGTINGNQIYAEYQPAGKGTSKYYTIGKSYGVSGKINDPGNLISVADKSPIILNKKNPVIELTSVEVQTMYELKQDGAFVYTDTADVMVDCINYDTLIGMGNLKTWATLADGTPFSKTVLQTVDDMGESLKWKINVPESGTYDLVISLASPSGNTNRLFMINNHAYDVSFKTDMFNDVDSFRVKTNLYLEAGETDLSMYVNEKGTISLYQIGFIKSDK